MVALLAGCQGRRSPSASENGPYLPPTLSAALAPTAVVTPTAPQTAPQPACTDQLIYLEDVTIPDGSVVAPGATLDKRWSVRNAGTCNWNENYRLKLIAGPDLGARPEQALYPARSGAQAEIRILFQAPADPGEYRSAWQAFDAQGQSIGDPIFIDVVVAPPSPTP